MSTPVRRLLAIVAAIALVLGALLAHGDFDSGGGGGGGTQHSGAGHILCAAELDAVCQEIARTAGIKVDVAPAGSTVADLSTIADGSPVAYDGWLTFAADANIVIEARARSSLGTLLEKPLGPIARSPLVLAVSKEREAVLTAHCGGHITVKCVGDVAGGSWSSIGGKVAWGDVKPGHADPSTSGEGLAVIGQEAAQYFGRTNLSLDDFSNDGFLQWFTQLERSVPNGASADAAPFERMLSTGPAAYDVVATTEAEAGPLLASASRDRRAAVDLLYPAPVATAEIVYAPVVGGDTNVRDAVTGDSGRRALAHAGWRVDGESFAKGVSNTPALPAVSNLPEAGALEALLQTWREVTQ